jgi:hypothetical protein
MDIKFTAKEIVRAMTPAKLSQSQKEYLLHCSEIVIMNQLNKAETKTYKIYSEGYCANETEGRKTDPVCLGTSDGKSFEDACVWKFKNDKFFDHKNMTYWGCKLYGYSEKK